ncbi:hypothetical protein [Candidatus Phytoplasma fraxini]|uniref:hypothetical protein n=1 Tax=Ash yellows phytoplasma TaxID=35780 RepID=UPI0030FEDA5A
MSTYKKVGKYRHPIIKVYQEIKDYQDIKKRDTKVNIFLNKNIISVSQHVLVPLFYFILFFFFIPFSFKDFKRFFFVLLHPLLYLMWFYFQLLFMNGSCESQHPENCWLPYPNIQCNIHGTVLFKCDDNKIWVLTRIIILCFVFSLLFFKIFLLKNKFNEKYFNNKKRNKKINIKINIKKQKK